MSEPCPDCGLPVLVLDGRQVRLPGSCRCEPVPSADEPGGVPEAADPEAAAVLEVAALGADDDEGWPPPEDEPPGDDAAGPGGLADHPGLAAIAAKYTPVDWGTAWKNQPEEVQWLIEPILEAGTVNVLFAKVDTGKSLLALELSLRLVRDGHTVVYVDEENRVTDVVDRLKAFGAEPGELDRLLFFSYAALPSLDTVTGGVHLLAVAVAAGASLVILDTTTRMVQGRENDSDTFLALYRCSLVPLKSRGITVLRLDHPGKDEARGQRGSSAKDGDCDTIWRLTEVVKNLKYRLRREKNRSGHAPDSGDLAVERRYDPVRHPWAVPDRSAEKEAVGQLCGQLDRLKVPPSAGRDRCRAALNEAGIPISNDLLAEVVRQRRFAPDSSRTAGQSGPVSDQLSAVPPHTECGGDGQVAHPSADSPGGWPPGSLGDQAQQPPTEGTAS